ncbi:MAG: hypothetical protein ACJAUT_000859 [Cellvibrionaceae bacterium]|jgi:uncharacterized protein YciI
MWYAIICEDKPNSLALRMETRPAHLAALQLLQNEGRLLTAGPLPAIDSENPGDNGFTGSVIIAEFDSISDAQTWAQSDPYAVAGVFANVVVKPYKKVF